MSVGDGGVDHEREKLKREEIPATEFFYWIVTVDYYLKMAS